MNFADKLTAGDTLNFTTELSDYPASAGWSLRYTLVPRAAGGPSIVLNSTADGDLHRTQATAEQTANWAPGAYSWVAAAVKDGERYTLDQGALQILPDPTSATALDTRSSARIALENVEAYMANASNLAAASYSIAGRTLSRHSLSELLKLRSQLQLDVAREDAAARASAGLPDKRRIHVRYGA